MIDISEIAAFLEASLTVMGYQVRYDNKQSKELIYLDVYNKDGMLDFNIRISDGDPEIKELFNYVYIHNIEEAEAFLKTLDK